MAPHQVQLAGKPLLCNHCGRDLFLERDALLNTPFMTLLKLDWMNQAAQVYVCAACGHLHWFLQPEYPPPDTSPEICRNCNTRIPPNADHCSACGWTWNTATAQSDIPT